MIKIEEKSIEALIARLENLKAAVEELENDIRALAEASEPEAVPEPEPEPEAVPEPEPVEPVEEEPVDGDMPVEEPEPVADPEPVAEPEPEAIDITPEDDTPLDIDIPEVSGIPVTSDINDHFEAPRTSILDAARSDTAVMDVMAEKQAWRTDRPGMSVKNIISAISLNDRVLLINVLFDEDPMLFQDTIAKFNAMSSLDEALSYISANFPRWDMDSEPVYRLMMAVRRKLN